MFDVEKMKLIAMLPSKFKGAYIAGGAIRSVFTNSEISDLDIYFKNKEAFIEAVVGAFDCRMWCVSVSKRAVTFAYGTTIVQFMYFDFFPEAKNIFENFDFTVCMAAIDLDTEEFFLHDDFLKHNSQRFLRFNPKTRFPIASAIRVMKYLKKGYTIGNGEFLKVILASRLPALNSWDDLKDQIGGAYGDQVLLKNEDKPFSLETALESFDTDTLWTRHAECEVYSADMLLSKIGMREMQEEAVVF